MSWRLVFICVLAVTALSGLTAAYIVKNTGDLKPRQSAYRTDRGSLRCRVLEVREVVIRDDAPGDSTASYESNSRPGLEYEIIVPDGSEHSVVQEFREGDRIIQVGETCRLWTGNDGESRVMSRERVSS